MIVSKIDAFRTVQPKPRRTRASGSAATEQLQECFAQADQIAGEKLDKLAVQFAKSEPTFFRVVGYFAGLLPSSALSLSV